MLLDDNIRQMLRARDLSSPDGRPLYEYRATEAELAGLRECFEVEVHTAIRHRRSVPSVAQGFCLWAAEWWRSHHEQGPWRWVDVLRAAGCEEMDTGSSGYGYLCELVSLGMEAWGRQVLRVGASREFLLTLACEGGLPLRMVRREHGRLRRYFRALLEEVRVFGGSRTPPTELAQRVGGYLPRSLQNEVVYRLSGDLAHAVWELQARIGATLAPAAELDRVEPGWRDRLPLRLDDETARTFLDNLLLDAVRVARAARHEIRWCRILRRTGSDWELTGEPSVPAVLDPEEVTTMFGIEDAAKAPDRFTLLLHRDDGCTTLLALATARVDREGRRVLGLEHGAGTRARVVGPEAALGSALLARDGTRDHLTRTFGGAGALEADLPWVFTSDEHDEASFAMLAGQGSLSVRAGRAWVAVPEGCVSLDEPDTCSSDGALLNPPRKVFRVQGTAAFVDAAGARTVVRTGAAAAPNSGEYWLDGPRAELGREGIPVFRGVPRLRIQHGDGRSWGVPDREVLWLPEGSSAPDAAERSRWVGEGRLRHVVGGEVRSSARIQVLPAGASLRYLPGSAADSGAVEFAGCDGAIVSARVPPEVRWQADPSGDAVRLRVETVGDPPATLEVVLGWADRGRMHLRLPFPVRGGGFVLPSGQRLGPDAVVAQDRMAGVRGIALVPREGAAFHVEGTVRGTHAPMLSPGRRTFRVPMDELERGHFELDLGRLHAEVSRRLEEGGADAEIRLRIQSNEAGDIPTRSLTIRRFDLRLQHERGSGILRIGPEHRSSIPAAEIDALQLRAVPLSSPEGPETILPRLDSTSWEVPDRLAGAAPWLILGEHREWLRVAPLSWPVASPSRSGAPVEDSAQPPGCDGWPAMLAGDACRPEWTQVDAMFRWSLRVPPSTLPALRDLARDPAAAALAALRAAPALLPQVWRVVDAMGGWWPLVPRSAWEQAARVYWEALGRTRAALEPLLGAEATRVDLEGTFDKHIGEVVGLAGLQGLGPVLGFVRGRLLGAKLPREVTVVVHDAIGIQMLERRTRALNDCPVLTMAPGDLVEVPGLEELSRALASLLPDSPHLWVGHTRFATPGRKAFVNAPVAAALVALSGAAITDVQRRALRHVHDLHPSWFREMYDCVYLYALGALERAKPQRAATA